MPCWGFRFRIEYLAKMARAMRDPPLLKGTEQMASVVNLQPNPAPIVACTISRDVQNFDLLIDDMEHELGENWGDLSFADAPLFLDQPESATLEFVAIAVDGQDTQDMAQITDLIKLAKSKNIKVVLIAHEVSPVALHQLLRLGANDFVPYPLPDGALHEAIARMRAVPAPAKETVAAGPPQPRRTPQKRTKPTNHPSAPPASRPKATARRLCCPCMACRAALARPHSPAIWHGNWPPSAKPTPRASV
jgi:pilus assembly protein CpaE